MSVVAIDQLKIIVIKCGGSIVNDKHSLVEDIVSLKHGGNVLPVIVHGGGPDISKMCEQLHIKSNFVRGQRVTDHATLDVCQMILLGKTNCKIVTQLNQAGVSALGLSGHDANLLQVQKYTPVDLGFVGEVTKVNTQLLKDLLRCNYIPVIAPIGVDVNGQPYNVNGDFVASAVAGALSAEKLILLTDVDGYYTDFKDRTSLCRELTLSQVQHMLDQGQIQGGMNPKLQAGVNALTKGVNSVHLVNGNLAHGLLNSALGRDIVQTKLVS